MYDNAESEDVLLKFWPVACSKGSVLVTTRNRNFAFGPADFGIEIPSFDVNVGSQFLLHLLRKDIASDVLETESAVELSEKLSGHALALSHMAGLIQTRSWRIKEFLSIYEKNRRKFHHDWTKSLATVLHFSFEELSIEALTLLGVLAYISPDSIPSLLFDSEQDSKVLPENFSFCMNKLDFSDAIDPLVTLALIKRDRNAEALSIHRLVQVQYRYYLSLDGRQKAFEDAASLLDAAFPRWTSASGMLYDKWSVCQKYVQHVNALSENYKLESGESESEPLRPTLHFCQLLHRCCR